jgi:hypothetical protein
MERRYGDDARITYYNVESDDVKRDFGPVLTEIDERGLLFPVTVVDGVPLYDGAVSYPAIIRAVHNKLLERAEA